MISAAIAVAIVNFIGLIASVQALVISYFQKVWRAKHSLFTKLRREVLHWERDQHIIGTRASPLAQS